MTNDQNFDQAAQPFVGLDFVVDDAGTRATAHNLDEAKTYLARGLKPIASQPDGFRKPKRRPKGWLKGAISRGEVADPARGAQPHQSYDPANTFVVDVPTLTADAAGKDS